MVSIGSSTGPGEKFALGLTCRKPDWSGHSYHLRSLTIGGSEMAENVNKLPIKTNEKAPAAPPGWRPFESMRNEMNRLFDDFDRGFWRSPFRNSVFDIVPLAQRQIAWPAAPAVDVVEKDNAYEIIAELPGMDEKNVEVKVVDDTLTIKGEKQEEKEEKKKDYYLQERHFGSFERAFAIPQGVDTDMIEASFKKGVLTVRLPKKPEAVKPEKKITVKAA
jgi:HSP20 family protein